MSRPARPLGVTVLSAGWLVLGIATFGLALATLPLAILAASTDASSIEVGRELGGLGLVGLALVLSGALCGTIAYGLWTLRRWGWRLAIIAQVTLLTALIVRAWLGLSVPLIAGVAVTLAALDYLVRRGVRSLFT